MYKKEIATNIGFADSEFKSFYKSSDNTITVFLTSWDNNILKLVFKNSIQCSYGSEDVPSILYEITGDNSYLNEALKERFGFIPLQHCYKLFQLEDIDDFPFIQIVAESVNVTKEQKNES